MALIFLLIASNFVLSSSQTACLTAYNDTLGNSPTDSGNCSSALASLRSDYSPDNISLNAVCQEGEDCNTRLRNITNTCGDSIYSPTEAELELTCSTTPEGRSCSSLTNDDNYNILVANTAETCISSYLVGQCSPECMQGVQEIHKTYGCCFALQLLSKYQHNRQLSNDLFLLQASLIPRLCGFEPTFCNGTSIQSSQLQCDAGINALFDPGDDCSNATRALILNFDYTNIAALYNDDCPNRFQIFTEECEGILENINVPPIDVVRSIMNLSQISNVDGVNCSNFVPILFDFFGDDMDDDDVDNEFVCIADFKFGRCSDECRMILLNITETFGCCFNIFISSTIGQGDGVSNQIEYAILTREMFSLCNISSPGFCGETYPQYTTEANRCINATRSFFGTTNVDSVECLNHFRTLGEMPSSDAVDIAAAQICTGGCRKYLNDYINYLAVCQVVAKDDDGIDDDGIDDDQLAHIAVNTTCRVNQANQSCYSVINNDATLTAVGSAFDECASVVKGNCSTDCQKLLTQAHESTGCCLAEYGRVLLGPTLIEAASQICNISSLNTRCPALDGSDSGVVQGGVDTVKGLGVFTLLWLGMLVIFTY